MQMTQVLADISNKTGTPTIRATGAATATTMAEVVDTGIMTTEAATVATKIIDGDGTDVLRIFEKTLSSSRICAQLPGEKH